MIILIIITRIIAMVVPLCKTHCLARRRFFTPARMEPVPAGRYFTTASMSAASWRSASVWVLTTRPRRTAGRSAISCAQRTTWV